MDTQAIEYQGCLIELQHGGRRAFGRNSDHQWANVKCGERVIAAFGIDVVDQVKEVLDLGSFDCWFSIASPDEFRGDSNLYRFQFMDDPHLRGKICAQGIEYQGCRIEPRNIGRYVWSTTVRRRGRYEYSPPLQRADVVCGEYRIAAYGIGVIKLIKAHLDKTSFDDWYKNARNRKGSHTIFRNFASHCFYK